MLPQHILPRLEEMDARGHCPGGPWHPSKHPGCWGARSFGNPPAMTTHQGTLPARHSNWQAPTEASRVVIATEGRAAANEVDDSWRGRSCVGAVALLAPEVQPDAAPHAAVLERAAGLLCAREPTKGFPGPTARSGHQNARECASRAAAAPAVHSGCCEHPDHCHAATQACGSSGGEKRKMHCESLSVTPHLEFQLP